MVNKQTRTMHKYQTKDTTNLAIRISTASTSVRLDRPTDWIGLRTVGVGGTT